MASSENLASMEPWSFRPTFADSWISEAYARDTDTLTRALQKTLSSHSDYFSGAGDSAVSPFFKSESLSVQTPSGSGSELETATPKRRNAAGGVAGGKISKRKSRASKRATTTFITADPANFRQMVQQVTGVRFPGGHMPVNPVLKPEPQRAFNRLQGCLPTLDTSAFLLDHHLPAVSQPAMTVAQPTMVAEGGGGGFDFESFSSFPTLESWN